MAFNFPNTPTEGQIFTDATSGAQYIYTNGVWMQSSAAQIKLSAETRNRIVNPAMQISQENGNTPASASGYYAADQWSIFRVTSADVYTQRVQVVTPNKSVNRYQITLAVTDTSLAAGDLCEVFQVIEGMRIADFGWGAPGARQVILRFGWKSPAGTYGISLHNSAQDRTYLATFTISAAQANTDTEQILIIPGDTTGTWLTDTGKGVYVIFGLAGGSAYYGTAGAWQAGNFVITSACSNGLASTGNIFNIFDVGLYLDPQVTSVAPAWTLPDEAQELAACERYYQSLGAVNQGLVDGNYQNQVTLRTAMRIQPTVSSSAGAWVATGGDGVRQGSSAAFGGVVIKANARM